MGRIQQEGLVSPSPAYPPPPVNPPAYPPAQVNPPAYPPAQEDNYHPQTQPPVKPQTPPLAYPPPPVHNDPPVVQFPPPQEHQQQQYNQFQQSGKNNNVAGQGNNYYQGQTGIQMQQQAPVAAGIPITAPTSYNEGWKTQLFDCMNDPTNALITLCFPCITFGQIAEIIDDGQSACATSGLIYGALAAIGLPCILSCSYRTKLRNKFGLEESPAPDWITHVLCEPCALCQAYRELEQRGLDPSIGWIGNVVKQQQQPAAMMAPTYQNMNS